MKSEKFFRGFERLGFFFFTVMRIFQRVEEVLSVSRLDWKGRVRKGFRKGRIVLVFKGWRLRVRLIRIQKELVFRLRQVLYIRKLWCLMSIVGRCFVQFGRIFRRVAVGGRVWGGFVGLGFCQIQICVRVNWFFLEFFNFWDFIFCWKIGFREAQRKQYILKILNFLIFYLFVSFYY